MAFLDIAAVVDELGVGRRCRGPQRAEAVDRVIEDRAHIAGGDRGSQLGARGDSDGCGELPSVQHRSVRAVGILWSRVRWPTLWAWAALSPPRVVDGDWRQAAEAWIREQLDQHGDSLDGPIEQPRVRPWSTQLTVPTSAGRLWFKANAAALAFEPAVQLGSPAWLPMPSIRPTRSTQHAAGC